VVPARSDPDLVLGDLVDEAVLVGDPTGPVAVKPVLERFGLPDPQGVVALDVLDERVDALEDLAVLSDCYHLR
jgi:hypothetical protein